MKAQAKTISLGCVLALVVALLLMMEVKIGQAQQAPITTPQLNTDFYVAAVSGFYPSIQNAVTLRCAASGLGSRVIIQAGSPADGTSGFTISAVTGGCAQVPIIDLRATPPGFYKWISTAYVLQPPTGGAAGGALNGTYPNPSLANVNGAPGTCGDATHVGQSTINAAGQTTACTPVAIAASPSGSAGGDLNGSYPNPGVAQVNGAAVPASSSVLASNASRQPINATKQGNGTSVQMAAGSTHVLNDLLIYDVNGNAVDSSFLLSNVPNLSGKNTWNGSTTVTIDPTNIGTTANSISGANGAVKQWSISDIDGSTILGAATGGQTVIVPASVTGENAGVTEWQVSNITGAAGYKTLAVNTAITNAAGLQTVTSASQASCAGNTTCTVTFTLAVAEPDTAYKVFGCTIINLTLGSMFGSNVANTSATAFVVNTINISATASSTYNVQCLVVHN